MRQYFRFIHEFEDINPYHVFQRALAFRFFNLLLTYLAQNVRPVSIIRITRVITETHSLNRSVALIDVGVY